jgi:hypothetical protein
VFAPEFIGRILQLAVDGFDAWKAEGFPRYRDEEVPYTAVLVGRMRRIAHAQGLPFIASPERVRYSEPVFEGLADPAEAPRIDIGVPWGAGVADDPFFSFECKRLAPGRLARLYVDQGMMRFVTGYYAPDTSVGGMIGYVVGGGPVVAKDAVNARVRADSRLGATHELGSAPAIGSLNTVYASSHDRAPAFPAITLTHLFFDMQVLPGAPQGPARAARRRRS